MPQGTVDRLAWTTILNALTGPAILRQDILSIDDTQVAGINTTPSSQLAATFKLHFLLFCLAQSSPVENVTNCEGSDSIVVVVFGAILKDIKGI
jgi:hypothetical protein